MSVLSDVDIRKIISKNKGIIIMNMHDKKLTAVGYDFTIGFICDADKGKEPNKIKFIYDPKSNKEYKEDEFLNGRQLTEENKRNMEKDGYKFRCRYELLPGCRYLVISEEYITLLHKYMATLHSRGSYALKGLVVTSTTIDPNYRGFVYASLMNCSQKPVYIKEHNQFVTMVVHKLTTATNMTLPKNESGMPMDAEQTLSGSFSNICEEAVASAKMYRLDSWKKIEQDFENKYADFRNKKYVRKHLVAWGYKIGESKERIVVGKEFWIGLAVFIILIIAFVVGGLDKVVEVIQNLR